MVLDIDTVIMYMTKNLQKKGFEYLYPEKEDIQSSLCMFRSQKEMLDHIDMVINLFESKFNQEIITIYRVLIIDNVNDIDLDNLGIYWSFEETGALNFARYNLHGNCFLMKGQTSLKNIDFTTTFENYYGLKMF